MATISFVETLRLNLHDHDVSISQKDLAAAINSAATEFLEVAARGRPVTDALTKEQTGVIMAALMWNYNPAVRAAVRPK